MKDRAGSVSRRKFVAASLGLLAAANTTSGQQGSSAALNHYSEGNLAGSTADGRTELEARE